MNAPVGTAPSSVTSTPQKPGAGSVVMGIIFILGWTLTHVVLYYLLAVSGFLVDAILAFIRSFLFPGSPARTLDFGWTFSLTVGLVLAGAAGIPAGLAIFMRERRKKLLRGFLVTFAAGIVFELYAAFSLLSNAFSG